MSSISNKIIGASIAIGIDGKQTADNVRVALANVEKQLGNVKFEPKSLEIVKIDSKNIELMIRDTENNAYRLKSVLDDLNIKKAFEVDKISIKSNPFAQAEKYIQSTINSVQKLKSELEKVTNANIPLDSKDKVAFDIGELETSLANASKSEQQYTDTQKMNVNASIESIKVQINTLKELQSQYNTNDRALAQLQARYGSVQSGNAKITGNGSDVASIDAVSKALGRQASQLNNVKVNNDDWVQYTYNQRLASGVTEKLTVNVNRQTGELRTHGAELKKRNNENMSLMDKLAGKFKDISIYASASAVIYKFFNEFKRGITIVKDVDSAMTELKKVTDETELTYQKFIGTASKLGGDIGKSVKDVITATAEFTKLGYSLEEATNLAENALILTNIGDGIVLEDSVGAITSAMKGFELDKNADEVQANSLRIIDAVNAVSNNYAVSVTDITDSVAKMSAVMNQSGVTFEESIGMFVAGQEIMQDSSKISHGLLTISQRLRGISEEGEDLSNLQPTLEKQFNKMGLTLVDSNGELKSTYDIFNDLNSVWDDQSSQMQQYVGELIAGKQQISVLQSTLQGWSSATEATTTALTSQGSAIGENEKVMDSIQGSLQKLTVALETLWTNTISSDMVKGFIDVTTSLVKLIDTFGLFSFIVSGVTVFLVKHAKQVKSVIGSFRELTKVQGGLNGFFNLFKKQLDTTSASAKSTSVAVSSLKTAFIGIGVLAVTAGINYIASKIEEAKQEAQEAMEASYRLAEAYEDETKTLNDQIQTYEDLTAKLSDSNLSATETLDVKRQLLDLQNELVSTYGAEVEGLSLTSSEYEKQLDILKDYNKEKAKEFTAENYNSFNKAKDLISQEKKIIFGSDTLSLDDEQDMALADFLKGYDSEHIKYAQNDFGDKNLTYSLEIKTDAQTAKKELDKLFGELNDFAKKNEGVDVSDLLTRLSHESSTLVSDEIQEAQKLFDSYIKAQILGHDTLSSLYTESEKAIKDYNMAFASGEGFAEAKDNLSNIQSLVSDNVGLIDGASSVFDTLFGTVSTGVSTFSSSAQSGFDDVEVKLSEVIDKVVAGGELLKSMTDEYNDSNTLSSKSLSDIIKAYPQLEQAVADYHAKKLDEKALLEELEIMYENDVSSYKYAIATKMGFDAEFYNRVFENFTDSFIELGKKYKVDLDSYKTYNQAKLALDEEYAEKKARVELFQQQIWEELSKNTPEGMLNAKALEGNLLASQSILTDYERYMAEFDKAVEVQVRDYTPAKEKEKKSKKDREFENEVDWADKKIKSIQNELDNLDKKLANSQGLDARRKAYDKLIEKQKELSEALRETEKLYEDEYNNALKNKNLTTADRANIQNGSYNIEDFKGKGENSGSELRYKAITEALSLKDKFTSSQDALQDSETEITNLAQEYAGLRWDDASKKVDGYTASIEKLNAELDNAKSYSDKNVILGKILEEEGNSINAMQSAIDGDKTEASSLYGQINKKSRVNNSGKSVSDGYRISTKGITDANQLALIKKYNELVLDTRDNEKHLALERENHSKNSADTAREIYSNNQSALDDSLSLVSGNKDKILDTISQIESLGGNGTKKQYDDLMALSNKEIGYYQDKKKLAQEQLKGLNKTDIEYAKIQKTIQECEQSIAGAEAEQIDWNVAVMRMPIKTLEEANKVLEENKKTAQTTVEDLDKVIGAVTDGLDGELEVINQLKDNANDDTIEGSYANQVKQIQDKIDKLKEVNEEHKREMELQKAKYEAERARNQKTELVYREGEGFVYEANQQAFRDAQDKLDDLEYQGKLSDYEDDVERLEKEKEAHIKSLDERAKALENIKKQWADIANTFEKMAGIKLADEILGDGWKEKIINGDTSSLDFVKGKYLGAEGEISDLEAEIKANDLKIESIEGLVTAYQKAEEEIIRINSLIGDDIADNSKEVQAVKDAQQAVRNYANEWALAQGSIQTADNTAYAGMVIAKENEKALLDERIANLSAFAKQLNALPSITPDSLSQALTTSGVNDVGSSVKKVVGNASKFALDAISKKANKQHTGMELGYADNKAKSNDAFRYISLDTLKPNELMKVVEKNEAILTKGQQGNIVSNMANSFTAGMSTTLSKLDMGKASASHPNFSIGNINLHGVDNVDKLADAIAKDFLPTLNQRLHR